MGTDEFGLSANDLLELSIEELAACCRARGKRLVDLVADDELGERRLVDRILAETDSQFVTLEHGNARPRSSNERRFILAAAQALYDKLAQG
jgi:hypothetical protein